MTMLLYGKLCRGTSRLYLSTGTHQAQLHPCQWLIETRATREACREPHCVHGGHLVLLDKESTPGHLNGSQGIGLEHMLMLEKIAQLLCVTESKR